MSKAVGSSGTTRGTYARGRGGSLEGDAHASSTTKTHPENYGDDKKCDLHGTQLEALPSSNTIQKQHHSKTRATTEVATKPIFSRTAVKAGHL